MATVRKSNYDWNGQPYWGLVQQNGPWSSTPGDIKRANEKDIPKFGGGIGVGGRKHAGHSIFESFMNPYQINATGAPPPPSGYARPTVMMASVDMKRVTKMGKAKQGLTLAARTPLQTGQKMGLARPETTQTEAGDIKPPMVSEATSPFTTTHHIIEMPDLFDGSDSERYRFLRGDVHILPVDYPTQPSPVLPYTDQMDASTVSRDFERQAVMGRQIESIDSNYKEAERFTATGEEMRATTTTTNVIRDALKKLAEDQGVPVEVIYQQAQQYTLPGQEMRATTTTTNVIRDALKKLAEDQGVPIEVIYQNAQQVTLPQEMRATRQGPIFGPTRAPRRIANRPPRINTLAGGREFRFKGRPQDGENLIGARFGTGRNPTGSAPKKFDEVPDVSENGPPAQNTRKRTERRQVSRNQ